MIVSGGQVEIDLNEWTASAKDLASMLGVGVDAIYEAARDGVLPNIRVGRKLRFRPADAALLIKVNL